MQENNIIYHVREVIQETPKTVTLLLSCDGVLPSYRAGQFITIFFPETGHSEGKSYSLSGASSEKYIRITVKGVGVFSNMLLAKKVGDTIVGSSPYGYFYTESETSDLVMITGGIGIAPFRSMILESLKVFPKRTIILYYSNKKKDSIIFKNELDRLVSASGGVLAIQYYITQEVVVNEMRKGRIQVRDIVEESKCCTRPEFFICGSISFVREYWKGLIAAGISEERIYTEAFF